MRILGVGAALVAVLFAAGQARAQVPTNVHQVAQPNSGFNFSISKLLGSVVSTVAPSTKPTPPPIAQPQPVSPRNKALSAFLPKPQLPTGTPTVGFSTYPSLDQMPGTDYLKAFGARIAPRVPLN
ncbi:MAG TPA: hypothetical protein VKE94_17835 [Gemmataceae bacterium]|jgi:hypothetical protein|nr:hypothetical protein [Gemmataceae bacterium]